MADAKILVASDSNIAQVRVIGRATFSCSQSLRDFGLEMVGAEVRRFLIDLSECQGMDSTFMGIMALIARRVAAKGNQVEIVNAGKSPKKLLGELGITKLFAFTHTNETDVDWSSLCKSEPDDDNQQQTILEAHETLMEADAGNIPKFKNVVEFLKQDLRQQES
jgi:anti-anti-sigma regulatory factor